MRFIDMPRAARLAAIQRLAIGIRRGNDRVFVRLVGQVEKRQQALCQSKVFGHVVLLAVQCRKVQVRIVDKARAFETQNPPGFLVHQKRRAEIAIFPLGNQLARPLGPFDTPPTAVRAPNKFLDPASSGHRPVLRGGNVVLVLIVNGQVDPVHFKRRKHCLRGIIHKAPLVAGVQFPERDQVNPFRHT